MKTFEAHGHACIVCGKQGEGLVTFHHLHTRKARPDLINEPKNKIPVCQQDHNSFHAKGTDYMAEKYPKVKAWLINRGWEKDTFLGKWLLIQDESSSHLQ
jgi:5-methylcytosine-specific restriction endonuclease McrA